MNNTYLDNKIKNTCNGCGVRALVCPKKCIRMAIVLAIIGIFPSIINFIGSIFKFDLSCIF